MPPPTRSAPNEAGGGDVKRPTNAFTMQRSVEFSDGSSAGYGAFARAIVADRDRIGNYLDPSLFADPAFDILLDLFASEEEGRKVGMSSCAVAARVPRTTGMRWICVLERKGLVERYHDPADQRVTLVRLTDAAKSALTRYLRRLHEIRFRNDPLAFTPARSA